MRILVCGSREFTNYELLYSVMEAVRTFYPLQEIVIIHGAARGADMLADKAGRALGYDVVSFPANWAQHGKRAGIIRNQQMLDEGDPDLVIAFTPTAEYTPGTGDMVRRAQKAGIPVIHIRERGREPVADRPAS